MSEQSLGWCSIEQSKKLIETGLDPNTADMHHIEVNNGFEEYHYTSLGYSQCDAKHIRNYLPCWSLGRLIELMPNTIETKKPKNLYFPEILPASNGIAYTALNESKEMVFLKMFTTGSEDKASLIDNMVSMVCWLLENNYIKKGG